MFLINWLEANIMMAIVVLILIGIPLFIGITFFSKKQGGGEAE